MVESKLFSIRSKFTVLLLLIAGFLVLLGCSERQKKDSAPAVVDEESRPPLRILMIGCPDLSEAIQLRWRSTSQQRLSIERVSIEEFQELSSLAADVVMYPAYLLGELVARQMIAPTPKRLLLEGSATQSVNTHWPKHWNRVANYGKKHWGIVLGAPLPVVIRSQHATLKSFQLTDLTSEPTGASSTSSPAHSGRPMSDDALLSNYLLMIAYTKQDAATMGTFFHLSDMRSRLTDKEYRQAAELLIQLHRNMPGGVGTPATDAWESVLSEINPWSIGLPGSRPAGEETAVIPDGIRLGFLNAPSADNLSANITSSQKDNVGISVDFGSGLMVSMSAMSRQSSASTFFLEWMDDEEQRLALSRMTELVVPAKAENNVLVGPAADYDRLCRQAWDYGEPFLELRLAGGIQYRKRMVQAIRGFLENPDRIDEELRKCGEDWDKITIAQGRDRQRNSAEQSYLLSE